jgi:hypothetical protein
MKAEDVSTVGDLITFLLQFDHNKRVMVYDNEGGIDIPLQHIDVDYDRVIFYS